MSWYRVTWRMPAAALVAASLLWAPTGCGSGAVEGPDADEEADRDRGTATTAGDGSGQHRGGDDAGGTSRGDGGGGGGDGDGGGGDEYSWSLPGGDLSPDGSTLQVAAAFGALRRGDCEGAASGLGDFSGRPGDFNDSEREALYRAAIAVCSGDLERGRELAAGVRSTRFQGDCRLYKAIWSVLDQRPQAEIGCPGPEGTSSGTTGTTDTSGTETTTGTTDTTDGPTTSEPTTSPTVSITEPTAPETGGPSTGEPASSVVGGN